jgi:hypothetical protein
MLFKVCGLTLALLASFFGFFALWFRADTDEELALGRMADTAVGVMFAVAFLFARLPPPSVYRLGWRYRTALGMALVWAGTGGPLLFLHAAVARVRFVVPRRSITLNRVKMAHLAMDDYMRDCGTMPPEGRGLEPLLRDPGVQGWSGPYLETDDLTDMWGNPIRYGTRDGRPCVWSSGPDGGSGTDDDIVSAQD